MSVTINSADISSATINGTEINSILVNDVEVFGGGWTDFIFPNKYLNLRYWAEDAATNKRAPTDNTVLGFRVVERSYRNYSYTATYNSQYAPGQTNPFFLFANTPHRCFQIPTTNPNSTTEGYQVGLTFPTQNSAAPTIGNSIMPVKIESIILTNALYNQAVCYTYNGYGTDRVNGATAGKFVFCENPQSNQGYDLYTNNNVTYIDFSDHAGSAEYINSVSADTAISRFTIQPLVWSDKNIHTIGEVQINGKVRTADLVAWKELYASDYVYPWEENDTSTHDCTYNPTLISSLSLQQIATGVDPS